MAPLAIVLGAVLMIVIVFAPRSPLATAGNVAQWNSEVQKVLADNAGPSSFGGVVAENHLAGVGAITRVLVERGPRKGEVTVLFSSASNANWPAMAYLVHAPAPLDSCAAHLYGRWWHVVAIDDATMSCPSGFNFTGGP
jgi:hypothetical protein